MYSYSIYTMAYYSSEYYTDTSMLLDIYCCNDARPFPCDHSTTRAVWENTPCFPQSRYHRVWDTGGEHRPQGPELGATVPLSPLR